MTREQQRHLKNRIEQAHRRVNTYHLAKTPMGKTERSMRSKLKDLQKRIAEFDEVRRKSKQALKDGLDKNSRAAHEKVLFAAEEEALKAVQTFEQYCLDLRKLERADEDDY